MNEVPHASHTSGRGRRTLTRVVAVLALFLVIDYLVLPQIAGVRRDLNLLSKANLGFVAAGVVLEAASLLAYAMLTRDVLPRGHGLPFATVLRIDLSTLAVSHLVPGGAAAGTGIGYRLLTELGVNGTDAGFTLAAQGFGSAIVLNGLLWLALVVSIPVRGFSPLYGTAAAVGAILIGGFSFGVLLLTRGEPRAARVMRRIARRLPILEEKAVDRLVHSLAARLRALGRDRGLLVSAVGWAAANWLLDAGSLWVFLAAFGDVVNPVPLLVAYCLAYVLAAIPVTPGGLGVVEAVLISTLVGFGTPKGIAILGVISYRLLNFWVPIPVGGLAYLTLRPATGRRGLGGATEASLQTTENLQSWASRHGMRLPVPPSQHGRTGTGTAADDAQE